MDTKDQVQTSALETAIALVDELLVPGAFNDTPETVIVIPHDVCQEPTAGESQKRSVQFSIAAEIVTALGDFFVPANIYSALTPDVSGAEYPQPVLSARIALRVSVIHGRRRLPFTPPKLFTDTTSTQESFNAFLDSVQVRAGVLIDTNYNSDLFPDDGAPEHRRGAVRLMVRARITPSR